MACNAPEDRNDGKYFSEDEAERRQKDRLFGASLRRLYDNALDEPLPEDLKDLLKQLK